MDQSRLKLEFKGFSPTPDGRTYQYTIGLSYGRVKWTLDKRFSNFAKLQSQLLTVDGLAGIFGLPSKTLIGRPNDPDAIKHRQHQLKKFLKTLIARPDIRTSDSLLKFLDFEAQTHSVVKSLCPTCVCSTTPSHLAIAGCDFVFEEDLMIVAQEDSSSLARLGKVWQIVEPDEAGYLSLWKLNRGKNEWHKKDHAMKIQKTRAVCYHKGSRQVFVGLGNGTIEVYNMTAAVGSVIKEGLLNDPQTVISAHEGPVVAIDGRESKLLSAGFDGSIRVIDCDSCKIVCGGRLTKRLDNSRVEALLYDELYDRAFLGTSDGIVLIYSVAEHPPTFVQSLNTSGGHPVSCICRSENCLFVGHGELVAAFSMDGLNEQEIERIGHYSSPLSSGRCVRCVTYLAERHWLFVGHDEAVCVWNLVTSTCICAFQVWGGVNRIIVLAGGGITEKTLDESQDDCFVIFGCGNGSLQLWKSMPGDYSTWHSVDGGTKETKSENKGKSNKKETDDTTGNGSAVDYSTACDSNGSQRIAFEDLDKQKKTWPPRNPAFMREKGCNESDDEYTAGEDLHDVLAPAKL